MPHILEKYVGYFPTNLFLCHDDLQSMHFILSIKHMPETQQNNMAELLHHCGAETSTDVAATTNHSAIIVDHNEIVNFKAPAFAVKYLEDCLQKLKLLHIHNYRQDVTKHIAKDDQCMNVVYYKNQGWDSVLTKAEKQWFDENVSSSRSEDFGEPVAASTCVDFLHLGHSRLGSNDVSDNSQSNPKEINGLEISGDEDSDIEDVDVQDNENETHNGTKETRSKSLHSKAQDTKQKNATTLHSEKDKNISSASRVNESRPMPSTSAPPSSKWSFLDDFQSESDESVVLPAETRGKGKKKNFFDFEAANEDLFKPNKDKKHSRMPYSYEEQSNILKYIIDHCEYSRIKGRELWMIMERRKVCPNRTWQSMKEHFMKKIALNLEPFDFLTESNKTKIKTFAF